MKRTKLAWIAALLVLAVVLGQPRFLVAEIPDWTALCAEAAKQFRPITKEDVTTARKDLEAAVARLEARFERAGPEVEGWKKYLQWTVLKAELAKDSPDLRPLEEVYSRLAAGYEGLQLTCFADVRRALQRYVALSRAVGDASIEGRYHAVLDNLQKALIEYQQSQDPHVALTIQDLLDWLELAGQAPELRAAVRDAFAQPNAFVRVKENFLASAFAEPVDVTEDVREIILGTDVRGKGHIVGQRSLELVPSPDRALMAIVVQGTIHSDTVGFNGPARIYSQSVTPFTARKLVAFSPDGLSFQPATCSATTHSDIQDVDVTCNSACVERIAWRRTFKQKSAAEWEAARKAERRVERRVDSEADPQLEKAAERYQTRVRQPLLDRSLFPQWQLSTSEDELSMRVLQLGHGGLGAADAPPEVAKDGAIALRVHHTWFNNLAEGFLGGMILKEERLQQLAQDLLGRVPEELKRDEGEEPWTVRFAARRPIAVTFADGRLVVEFRGETYWRGDRAYPGMDVRATYRIESGTGDKGPEIRLVREGPLTVLPPNFDPERDRLSVRQQTIRSLLERRFEKIFRETITIEPIKLEGQWAKAGPLVVTHLETTGGWLRAVLDPAR
ncbi:MAG: hypothetical protein H5U08_15460 [Thermogutta sp.]|uniref:hypothetical protein n=1 Tax=Thermogutta sp. TaxID=1962930 RepID=UPI0019910EF0|nr:hypothetical protein [Thermogutta sp.]MBC7353759.1 hypothetical protein [Thermogutta sp.]